MCTQTMMDDEVQRSTREEIKDASSRPTEAEPKREDDGRDMSAPAQRCTRNCAGKCGAQGDKRPMSQRVR